MLSCFSYVLLCNPMDCSLPGPLSMGFSRQEYWSGLPCPPLREFPYLGSISYFSWIAGWVFYHLRHLGCPVIDCRLRYGNGTPLQYSCLENHTDGGAWWAAVHQVAKGRTQLSDFTFTFYFHALEKEMATPSSVLAWRIPGTAEPGGLPSIGLHRVGHDWSNLAAAAEDISS